MSRSALALCLLAAVCGAAHPSRLRGHKPDDDERIVGGRPVDISQFPWQVSLEELKYGQLQHFGGGSIISSTWVLTAAHCTIRLFGTTVYVRAGSSFREKGGDVYRAARTMEHEDYDDDTKDYDFALVELSKPIAFGSNVQAVNLGSSEIIGGTKVNVSGWGYISAEEDKPEQLHAVTTSIIDRDACKSAYAVVDKIVTERMICAGAEGDTRSACKDACKGDSGGPLVAGNTQYGVASWGKEECALPGYTGVYSYVPAVRSWIAEKTGV